MIFVKLLSQVVWRKNVCRFFISIRTDGTYVFAAPSRQVAVGVTRSLCRLCWVPLDVASTANHDWFLWCGDAWPGIIRGFGSANEKWNYIVTLALIGWAHTHNDPCGHMGEMETTIASYGECFWRKTWDPKEYYVMNNYNYVHQFHSHMQGLGVTHNMKRAVLFIELFNSLTGERLVVWERGL